MNREQSIDFNYIARSELFKLKDVARELGLTPREREKFNFRLTDALRNAYIRGLEHNRNIDA